jgi:hypothetical protein
MLASLIISMAVVITVLNHPAHAQSPQTKIDLSHTASIGDGFESTSGTLKNKTEYVAVVYPTASTASPAHFNGATTHVLILLFGCAEFKGCVPRIEWDGDSPYVTVPSEKSDFYIELMTSPGNRPIGVVLLRHPRATPTTRSY